MHKVLTVQPVIKLLDANQLSDTIHIHNPHSVITFA